MGRIRLNDEREIPLFLLPHIISKQIRKTGSRIYRISVKRTHWHHYNVSVRTKALPRELAPGREVSAPAQAPPGPGNRNAAMEAGRGGSV